MQKVEPAYVPPYKPDSQSALKGDAPGFLDQIRGRYLYTIPVTLVGILHKCFPLFTGEFDKLYSKIRRWVSEKCHLIL